MKIGLINPVKYPTINLGLAYLISVLEKNGHQTFLIDLAYTNRPLEYTLDQIKKQNPNIVGFSVMTPSYETSVLLAKSIRKSFPNLPFIWGGKHPTLLPEETLNNPLVDFICVGEGEHSLPAFLNKLEKNEEIDVKGIWYKKNGKIVKNLPDGWIQDLDALPFPNFDYWDLKKYFRISCLPQGLTLLASRGCPYSCTYCSNKALASVIPKKYYRLRNPLNVIQEIKYFKGKYPELNWIQFGDEIFGLDKEWFREFVYLYKKENLHKKLAWGCSQRASLLTKEWCRLAKEAGCLVINLGLESGVERRRLYYYRKKDSDEKFLEAVKNLNKCGIFGIINIMVGGPEESLDEIEKGFSFAKRLRTNLTELYITPFHLLPKTYLEEDAIKKGYVRRDIIEMGMPRIEYPGMTIESIDKMVRKLRRCMFLSWIKRHIMITKLKFILKTLINSLKEKKIYPYFFLLRIEFEYLLNKWKKGNKINIIDK